MTYKTILVHIDAGDRCRARVEIAVRLARQFDAHLIGLNALTAIDVPAFVLAGEGGAQIAETQQRIATEQATRAKTVFDKAVSAAGSTTAEWRTTRLDAVDAVALHGRYADLIVIGQPDETADAGVDSNFAARATLESGRPMLVVPYTGSFASIGKRVLVAWNASREATRAVTDAIPFLQQAETVEIVAINPDAGEEGAQPGNDIALYLARHGVRVEVQVDRGVEIDDGGERLSRAADFRADLIVMGAYGRSRFRELVMGGVSRTVIESMTVPVLMSH